jgi:4-hydroxybenzoate polyprenyltransferase
MYRKDAMNNPSVSTAYSGLSRIKLFWALSRTPHGLLDMATPAFAALLWLGHFPSVYVIVLGLITTFAGYTAVYALNDLVDHRADKEKLDHGGLQDAHDYLDAVMVRHPIAQEYLSFREGFLWSFAWGLLALIGAYMLNPVCAGIFLGGVALEAAYCLLWRVSHLRTVVSGAVKTTGAMAAVFAVDPNPSPGYLLILFFCLFFWEIGGQNIPADWTDMEEDRRMHARTIPVRLGLERANRIILGSIAATIILNVILFLASPAVFGLPYVLAAGAIGYYLLLNPALQLNRSKSRRNVTTLFNKASYYPLSLLIVVVIQSLLRLSSHA